MWLYLLFAFLGGVLAVAALLAALLAALGLVHRSHGLMSVSFGGEAPTFYKDMELLEYEVRSGGRLGPLP